MTHQEVQMTKSKPTRVWKFRAKPHDERAVNDIQRLTSRYYNALIEIERERNTRFQEIRREFAPELAAAMDAYSEADDRHLALEREVKRLRQAHFRRTGERTLDLPVDLAEAIDLAKADKKAASATSKPLRKVFTERLKSARDAYKERRKQRAIELSPDNGKAPGPRTRERANAQVLEEMLAEPAIDEAWKRIQRSDAKALRQSKTARAESGLAPGVSKQVDDAVNRAIKMSLPRPPRHRRHDGKIAVQLRNATFADLLAGTSMAQLVPDPKPGRKGRSSEHFVVYLRVGSNPDRSPVWLSTSVRLHRRPPDDARVRWAWLTCRKRGERRLYELQLVLQHPSFAEPKRPAGVGHGGHVRIGWATLDEGVRIASWSDGDVVVPNGMLQRAERAEQLIGYADQHYEDVVRLLRRWQRLAGHGLDWTYLSRGPDWRREWVRARAEEYAAHWLGGTGAVRSMWQRWRADRLAAELDLHATMAEARPWLAARGVVEPEQRLAWWLWTWSRKDRHLRQWAADARAGFANARDAMFREAAIRLATQYKTVTIDDYSIADLKKLPQRGRAPGAPPFRLRGDVVYETAQHHLQLAAPGRFREIIREVFGDRCTPCERSGADQTPGVARDRRDHSGSWKTKASSAA